MIDITKQKAIFVGRESGAPPTLAVFLQTLSALVDLQVVDSAAFTGVGSLEISAPLFLDLGWAESAQISLDADWRQRNVVLLRTEAITPAAAPWLAAFSCLDLATLPEIELPRAVELAVAPEKLPGIVSVSGKEASIYYEKVTRLQGLGQRLDRFQDYFASKHPELTSQLYNLRQLTYALVYHAYAISSAASKVVPVVDFQIAADGDRLIFSTRFSSAPGLVKEWNGNLESNLLLRNAASAADLLVFTELTELKQVEIKAVISARGDYAGSSGHSALFATVKNFAPAPEVLAAQKKTKFYTISSIEPQGNAPAADSASSEETETVTVAPQAAAGGLNFKIKAEMLENEKSNLQGLVKKKSQLISELTKDVNRAQREVVEAQKSATKEILKMRMETEKAKNESRDAKRKLAAFQRKAAEAAEADAKTRQEGASSKQDFEKDFKQSEVARRNLEAQLKEQKEKFTKADEMLQKLRKEAGQVTGEMNLLKQQLLHATQRAANAALAPAAGGKDAGEEGGADKLKTAQKSLAEAKGREQELEKTMKALSLKLAAAEKNIKVQEQMFEKHNESTEKSLEEAKRQRSEMTAKLEEAKAEAKKKLEESNERERSLKKQIEELKAMLEKLGGGQAKAS